MLSFTKYTQWFFMQLINIFRTLTSLGFCLDFKDPVVWVHQRPAEHLPLRPELTH